MAHQREWEQGLVTTYQTYLRLLEAELKGAGPHCALSAMLLNQSYSVRSDLSESALYCMCTLLTDVTHFNFRVNLMTCIVARLSKKSWDKVRPIVRRRLPLSLFADI